MAPLVYVVDDERIITTMVVAILKNSGFEAVGFTHPLKALHAAATIFPDILLSDVFMP